MRIVFICHEAKRTGVPLLLLQLIRWLKTRHKIEAFVILLSGGPLEPKFEVLGPVLIWDSVQIVSKRPRPFAKFLSGLMTTWKRVGRQLELRYAMSKFKPDLVYLGTAACVKFVHEHEILFASLPKILHCHEMPYTLNRVVPVRSRPYFSAFKKIVIVNDESEKYFAARGIQKSSMLKVTEYFVGPMSQQRAKAGTADYRVVSVGLGSWRKGIDLFVQTAYHFSKIYASPFTFTWVGEVPIKMQEQLNFDIEKFGLEHLVKFAGAVEDANDTIVGCDLFFLSSREDPYPTVMLEAAWHAKPVVYFKNCGGASEFINDQELEALAFDVTEAAKRIKYFAEDRTAGLTKGHVLQRKIANHTVETVGEQIYNNAILYGVNRS